MSATSYSPEDYDRVDYLDVDAADHLRPFLAHVLAGLSRDDQSRFLGDLGRIAHQMRTERARHDLSDRQWQILETVRLEGALDVRRHLGPAGRLSDLGLVTFTGPHTIAPAGEW